MGRDGHVQPYFDEFVSFSSFHFLSPYFQPEDFENLIEKFFRCHLVVQNRKSIFYDWLVITRIKTTRRLQKVYSHMRFGRVFQKIMSFKILDSCYVLKIIIFGKFSENFLENRGFNHRRIRAHPREWLHYIHQKISVILTKKVN